MSRVNQLIAVTCHFMITPNGRIDQRKSIIELANKELDEFSMDQDKLKEIKKQRKQSRAFNTEHVNRLRRTNNHSMIFSKNHFSGVSRCRPQ